MLYNGKRTMGHTEKVITVTTSASKKTYDLGVASKAFTKIFFVGL